jgi:hypothetical protein
VRVGETTTALTGVIRYTPRPGAETTSAGPGERRLLLAGGVVVLGAALALLVARDRRHRRALR